MTEIVHQLYPEKFTANNIPEYSESHSFVNHGQISLKRVRDKLNVAGFDTDVLLQSHEHPEPTAAMSIGFSRNFPMFNDKDQLGRWGNEVVLRIHLGIFKMGSDIISVPHIEPDPKFCPLEHMMMYMRNDAIYDESAYVMLEAFLGDDNAWNIVHLRNVFNGVV